MSFRLSTSVLRTTRNVAARRPLSTMPRLCIKEDANRTPEEIEQRKQESLNKQAQGEGQWQESLGSASESNIAADREKITDHESHVSKLQQETKKKGEKGEL